MYTALEDELGDIVRKARSGQGIPIQELADASGLTKQQIKSLESYDFIPDEDTVLRIAKHLHLNGTALFKAARKKYFPETPPLINWKHLAFIPSSYEGMQVNSFLIWDTDSRQAALFDTGADLKIVRTILGGNSLDLRFIALTHTHGDHIAILDELKKHYAPQIITSPNEPIDSGQAVHENEIIEIGTLSVEVLETDGHSPGGLSYYINGFPNAPAAVVTGDALFAGSTGRANTSYDRLQDNVNNKLLKLPEDTLVLPGHGPLTTIGQECINNPFAR